MKIRTIMVPVESMDAALEFYARVLGLPVRFRDGDRYAALELDGLTLALVSAEDAESEHIALAVKTDDLAGDLGCLTEAGASLRSGPHEGGHEVRAVLADPSGRNVVLYQPVSPGATS